MTTGFIVDTETAGSPRFKIITFGCLGLKTWRRTRKEGFEGKKRVCVLRGVGALWEGGAPGRLHGRVECAFQTAHFSKALWLKSKDCRDHDDEEQDCSHRRTGKGDNVTVWPAGWKLPGWSPVASVLWRR